MDSLQGGAVTQVSLEVLCGVCRVRRSKACRWRRCVVRVGVRVCRSKTGLSHGASLEVLWYV